MITEFTQEDNDDGMTAFSFISRSDDSKVYLVPHSNRLNQQRIVTMVTDDPQFVFRLGPDLPDTVVTTWQKQHHQP